MFQTPKKSGAPAKSSNPSGTPPKEGTPLSPSSPPVKIAVSRYSFTLRATGARTAMSGIEKLLAEIDTETKDAWAKLEKARIAIEGLAKDPKADPAKVKAAEEMRTTKALVTFNNALNAIDIMTKPFSPLFEKPQIEKAREAMASIEATEKNDAAKADELQLAVYKCDTVEQVLKNFASIHDLALNAWGICKENIRQLDILINEATPGAGKTIEYLRKASAIKDEYNAHTVGGDIPAVQRKASAAPAKQTI